MKDIAQKWQEDKAIKLLYSIHILLILIFSHYPIQLYSQFYNSGCESSSVRWSQIRTGSFQLLFPSEYRREAIKIASRLDYSKDYVSQSLGHKPDKISIILHPYSSYSNGFVVWAPKRMELNTVPPQNNTAEDWYQHLLIHEYRHVTQVDKLNSGLTKKLGWLFGQQAVGGLTGFIPLWFFEGDAVITETTIGRAGRGELPSFERKIRANLIENNDIFSYEKMVFRSYRDFVPNHYEYGYQIAAYGRVNYGRSLWDKTLSYVAHHPYMPYPFYFGLKKNSGLSKTKLYLETMHYLDSVWKEQDKTIEINPLHKISKKKGRIYTNYEFPVYVNDSMILALKSGIGDIKQFVLINKSGDEKYLHAVGEFQTVRLSCVKGKIIWAEIIPDLRWEQNNYSIIKRYDIYRQVEYCLTSKTRYFAPVISPDGSKIAAIEVHPDNTYEIVIIHPGTGAVIKRLQSPGNCFLMQPTWVDSDKLAVMHNNQEGKGIMLFDVIQSSQKELLRPSFIEISDIYAFRNYILYRASYSGIDNIYALDIQTKSIYQVTSSRFGAYYPSVSLDGEKMVYSDYTSRGFDVVEIPFDTARWIPLKKAGKNALNHQNILKEQEDIQLNLSDYQEREYQIKPYSKVLHMFNIHSWSPFYFDYADIAGIEEDIDEQVIYPGFTLLSQDKLSTTTTLLGMEYNNSNIVYHLDFIYNALFPVFNLSIDYGGEPGMVGGNDSIAPPLMDKKNIDFSGEMYVPFNLSVDKYYKYLRPSVELKYESTYFSVSDSGEYESGMTYLKYRFFMYNLLRKSYRDIYPKMGQVIDINYIDTPFESLQMGNKLSAKIILYLPGLIKHQGIKVLAGYQKQVPKRYLFLNTLTLPRGYENYPAEKLFLLTFDYVFPIAYPDLNIGHIAYFKRVRGKLFGDYAVGENVIITDDTGTNLYSEDYYSFGGELTTDFHFAQIILPINIGIRYAYLPKLNIHKKEIVFDIDLASISLTD